jgi:hypothetical protein
MFIYDVPLVIYQITFLVNFLSNSIYKLSIF